MTEPTINEHLKERGIIHFRDPKGSPYHALWRGNQFLGWFTAGKAYDTFCTTERGSTNVGS